MANFGVPSESNQFTVWGNLLANNYNVTSDKKLKTNIKSLSQDLSALDVIQKLNPVDYDFKTDEYKNMHLPKAKQFGFVAQEIQQVLPNLVSKAKYHSPNDPVNSSSNEVLTVNYLGIIPILTQAIKEQQKIIDAAKDEIKQQQTINTNQQQQIDELKTMILQLQQNMQSNSLIQSNNKSSVAINNTVSLEQNIPNPFANTTVINYTLPQKFTKAAIVVTDKTGKSLKEINISGSGKGSITVDASNITAGAYQYSLLIDGKLFQTKQMIRSK